MDDGVEECARWRVVAIVHRKGIKMGQVLRCNIMKCEYQVNLRRRE